MQITIGSACFAHDGQALTVTSVDEPHLSVRTRLGSEQIEQLVEFLAGLPQDGEDRRHAFRVSIASGTGVQVRLRKNGGTVECVPRDISMVGLRVAMDLKAIRRLALDDELLVEILFDGVRMELAGRVRRLRPDSCGILFVDALRGDDVRPPAALARLVMELQRRWLSDVNRRVAH